MSTIRNGPLVRMPVLARPVLREGPGGRGAGSGVEAAAADCSKLRGLARDMCYRALARPL
jgi:hypothetical protein